MSHSVTLVGSDLEQAAAELAWASAEIAKLHASPLRRDQLMASALALRVNHDITRAVGRIVGLDLSPLVRAPAPVLNAVVDAIDGRRSPFLAPMDVSATRGGRPAISLQEWLARAFAAAAVDVLHHGSGRSKVGAACERVAREIDGHLRRLGVTGHPRGLDWETVKRYRACLSRGSDCGPGGSDGPARQQYLHLLDLIRTGKPAPYRRVLGQAVHHYLLCCEPDDMAQTGARSLISSV